MTGTKLSIRDLTALNVILRFQAVTYTGDDGYPVSALMDVIAITLHDGREFFLPNVRMVPRYEEPGSDAVQRYRPGVMVQRILDSGFLDLANWVQIENVSFEEHMADAADLEMRDRLDHGGSLFH